MQFVHQTSISFEHKPTECAVQRMTVVIQRPSRYVWRTYRHGRTEWSFSISVKTTRLLSRAAVNGERVPGRENVRTFLTFQTPCNVRALLIEYSRERPKSALSLPLPCSVVTNTSETITDIKTDGIPYVFRPPFARFNVVINQPLDD